MLSYEHRASVAREAVQPASQPANGSRLRSGAMERAHSIGVLRSADEPRPLASGVLQRFGTQIDLDPHSTVYADIVAARGGVPAKDGRNYATFYYPYPGAKLTKKSAGAGAHSEQRIHAALTKKQKGAVDRIHSEFEPCPESCSTLIQNNYAGLVPDSVTYWWGYGGDDAETKEQGRQAKKIDLAWMRDLEVFRKISGGRDYQGGGGGGGAANMAF